MTATTEKKKFPLAQVRPIAEMLRNRLEPVCSQIAIAGSIRRGSAQISDIEICCVPMRQGGLFGQADESLLDGQLAKLIGEGFLAKGSRNGPKWKTLQVTGGGPFTGDTHFSEGLKLDVFITEPAVWGMHLLVRTGPEMFSKAMVLQKQYGGYMPNGWKVDRGWRIIDDRGNTHQCRTEDHVFALYGLTYLEPQHRI